MTKILTIDLRSTAPRMLGSRGTPSQFVLYGLKNMCAKFDAFTRFVTMFPLTDRTKGRYYDVNCWLPQSTTEQIQWKAKTKTSVEK